MPDKIKMKTKIVIGSVLSFVIALTYISDSAYSIILLACAIFCAVAAIMVLTIWLIDGKFKVQYTVGLLPLIFIILFNKIQNDLKQKEAFALQQKIEYYKSIHEKYPARLGQLTDLPLNRKFLYDVDSNLMDYELEYYINAIDRWHYDSKSKAWAWIGEDD